jgi:hypothetical protein
VQGKCTYSIDAARLEPDQFFYMQLPTVLRPQVDESSQEFLHLYSSIKKQLEDNRDVRYDELKDVDGQQAPAEQADPRYAEEEKKEAAADENKNDRLARERAIMQITNNMSVDHELSNRPALRARLRNILVKATESTKQAIDHLQLAESKDSAEQIQALQEQLAKEQRSAQVRCIEELMGVWQQSRGINETYQCIRKFMDDYLLKSGKKNFCIPHRVRKKKTLRVFQLCFFCLQKLYKNISSFGEMLAVQMLDRESFGLDYRSHVTFLSITYAMLKTYVRDAMQIIVLLLGKHSQGKSNLMRGVANVFIPKTVENITVGVFSPLVSLLTFFPGFI